MEAVLHSVLFTEAAEYKGPISHFLLSNVTCCAWVWRQSEVLSKDIYIGNCQLGYAAQSAHALWLPVGARERR